MAIEAAKAISDNHNGKLGCFSRKHFRFFTPFTSFKYQVLRYFYIYTKFRDMSIGLQKFYRIS